ncbi:MAG: hypothetical protein AB9882_02495 [Ignavibacteriaceae bacterium]
MNKGRELSNISIGQDGMEIIPVDFALAEKNQQKEIIVNTLQDHHHQMVRLNDGIRSLEQKQKQVQNVLRSSSEYMEVQELRREIRDSKMQINALLMESQGMMKLSKKLGIDIKPGNIKQISQG